jgi:beta-mannanase
MWGGIDRRVLWSVPLIPTGATLAEAASGAYDDAHYRKAAGILKDFRPSEAVLHIRTAWEHNGDWFPWQCISSSCLADFIGAFRHFVTSFRSASPRFRFTFCPNVGAASATYPLEDSYPGDDYVDVIGIDLYAGWYPNNAISPEQRWQYELDRQYGLNWLVSFAKAHNKPIAIPEWGVGDNGSGDDPVFVKGMHDFCEANGCVYMSYWDSNADYKGELRAGQYPKAAAEYKTQFGHP